MKRLAILAVLVLALSSVISLTPAEAWPWPDCTYAVCSTSPAGTICKCPPGAPHWTSTCTDFLFNEGCFG